MKTRSRMRPAPDKNRSGCDPVPKPRGNPKLRMQWLPETAGFGSIGTVCNVAPVNRTGSPDRNSGKALDAGKHGPEAALRSGFTETRPSGPENESRFVEM